MKILIAPDSFKGSLSAAEAACSIEKGIYNASQSLNTVRVPLSDGGEGLVDALISATGGELIREKVTGPLGEQVQAFWGITGGGNTAVIEMAAASGLPLVPEEKRNPAVTTTYGTGELIKAALDYGCRRIIIGIGGSATNDGGTGMAQALGVKLQDDKGEELGFGGLELLRLNHIDISSLDARIEETEIEVACDVNNPLTGPYGASHIYAPQKGADPQTARELDRSLKNLADAVFKDIGTKVEDEPGAGAAGGLGAGLMAFLGGKLVQGIELVMKEVGFQQKLEGCSLVITGEGELNAQSFYGKVPVGVARRAGEENIPVIVLAGGIPDDLKDVHCEGITSCFSIMNRPMSLEEALNKTAFLLEATAEEIARLLSAWGTSTF